MAFFACPFFYFALIAVARLGWQPIWLVVLTDFIY